MNRTWWAGIGGLVIAASLGGCSSLLAEGGSAAAGIAGTSIAGALTDNASVATGIGIGVTAGARAGVQYQQRKVHDEAQRQVALVAGALKVGQVARWQTRLSLPLEAEESGRVTVSRLISSGELECKEIVFSVDRQDEPGQVATGRFFVASICRNGDHWGWASAEPATARWGSLQ